MHDNEHASHHHEESFISKYIFSLDHKTIGKQFLIYGLIMFFLGGGLALLFRWQLAYLKNRYPSSGHRSNIWMKAKLSRVPTGCGSKFMNPSKRNGSR